MTTPAPDPHAGPAGAPRVDAGQAVRRAVSMQVITDDGSALPVVCHLEYAAADPFAVRSTFVTPDGQIVWLFARDLLVDGLRRAVGEGDVRVWPQAQDAAVFLGLSSPSGRAVVRAPAAAVEEFVQRTVELVPVGREAARWDVDGLLVQLLA